MHTHSSSISKQVFADETHDLEKQQTADAIFSVSFQFVKCEIDIHCDCEAKALFIYCIACIEVVKCHVTDSVNEARSQPLMLGVQ